MQVNRVAWYMTVVLPKYQIARLPVESRLVRAVLFGDLRVFFCFRAVTAIVSILRLLCEGMLKVVLLMSFLS